MILFICLIFLFIGGVVLWYGLDEFEGRIALIGGIIFLIGVSFGILGIFHGFINYPATEGTHQGVITAVDREGIIFNHYRVYLKSSAYTTQGDETEYCAYLNETELVNQLKEYIGKQVKLNYSHPGGYIGIQSCGTYHIDSVELIEE